MRSPQASDAAQTLAEVNRLRRRVRTRAHGGAWLPAAAIAALLLASIALYRHPFQQPLLHYAEYPFWAGLPDIQRSPLGSYLFWFIAMPLLLAGIGLWYRWRSRRLGLRISWPLLVGTGLGVLLLLAVLAAMPVRPVNDPNVPAAIAYGPAWSLRAALTPLLAIAVVVMVLGWAERSRGLMIAGGWIALLTLWQCGYGHLGEAPAWVFWLLSGGDGLPAASGQLTLLGIHRPGPTLIIMALPLLGFAAIRALRARREQR